MLKNLDSHLIFKLKQGKSLLLCPQYFHFLLFEIKLMILLHRKNKVLFFSEIFQV